MKSLQDPYIKNLFQNDPIILSHFINVIPVGTLILNTERKIILINRALEALIGYSSEDVKGLPCHSIIRSKACINRLSCPASSAKDPSDSISIESDLINCDHQLIPIRITCSPFIGSNGKILGYLEIIEDLRGLKGSQEKKNTFFGFESIIGKSPEMERIFRILPILAESDSSILITGETGTGKDLIAKAIHQASNRAKGPFIKVNCGALPETLLESELFGHTKGAFTGAIEQKPGRFRMANKGTLYLTEIGDLPLPLQVKLLTFLDDKIIYPIGSTKGFQVDVRIIAATHRNLERMVSEGSFREDLFFRLNVVRLHLPPLRERSNDILLLLNHFLNMFSRKLGKQIHGFSPAALRILKEYSYPGNVRELKNIVEYAVNVCESKQILPMHLPSYISEDREALPSIRLKNRNSPQITGASKSHPLNFTDTHTWPDVERKMILEALIKTKGRRSEAAKLLGWARSTLWRKMKQYNIK